MLISHKPAGVPVAASFVISEPGVVQSAGFLKVKTEEKVFGVPSEKNTMTRRLERWARGMLLSWLRPFHMPSAELVKPSKTYLPMWVFMPLPSAEPVGASVSFRAKPRELVRIVLSSTAPYEK